MKGNKRRKRRGGKVEIDGEDAMEESYIMKGKSIRKMDQKRERKRRDKDPPHYFKWAWVTNFLVLTVFQG